ncbi:MAG: hypothetical protein CMJ85_11160 [Planctomycetes bacterium]|jgi:hypothetical protein|nr:hypothetical protein [Planctomycetota bacterium]MDP6425110.1 hypothetical protein [Planctomycetota bacterium]
MKNVTVAVLIAALIGLGACDPAAPDKQSVKHPTKGPHGGKVLEVGAHVAHLEIAHDEAAGKMTIWVLGPDLATPLKLAKPPQLKIASADGPRVIDSKPGAAAAGDSIFVAIDKALAEHAPEGRITVEINGKVYNPALTHDHQH